MLMWLLSYQATYSPPKGRKVMSAARAVSSGQVSDVTDLILTRSELHFCSSIYRVGQKKCDDFQQL